MAQDSTTTVRCSSVPTFPMCPRRWAASVLAEEVKAAGYSVRQGSSGIGAAVGIGLHRAAAVMLGEKERNGALPPRSVATDCAVDTVKEEIAKGVQYDERITPNASDAHQQVARMAAAYHGIVAPKIEPIMIEERLEAVVPGSKSKLILSGQPDVVAREPGTIVDTKGGSRLGAYQSQVGSYSQLVRSHAVAEDITNGRIDWVPRASMKRPDQPAPVERHYDVRNAEQMAANILAHIDVALFTWRNGDPERGLLPGDPAAFMSNPSTVLCSEKYCACHSTPGPNGWCTDYEPANSPKK